MPTLGMMSPKDMSGFEDKIAANLCVRVRPSGFPGLGGFTITLEGIPETNDYMYSCVDVRRTDYGSVELEYAWQGDVE